jgi:hypothetical protein
MSDDPDMKRAHYEATLRNAEMNWRAKFDFILHTDRIAAEIGIGAVRTAILINAGALVSLLALVGQLWDKDKGHDIVSHVLHAGAPFVMGPCERSCLIHRGLFLSIITDEDGSYRTCHTLASRHAPFPPLGKMVRSADGNSDGLACLCVIRSLRLGHICRRECLPDIYLTTATAWLRAPGGTPITNRRFRG